MKTKTKTKNKNTTKQQPEARGPTGLGKPLSSPT